MNIRFTPNTLYYGDCLDIMADFPDNSIDLICLDPPFNSNETYNKIFKGSGLRIDPQIKAFDDVWLWDKTSMDQFPQFSTSQQCEVHAYCQKISKKAGLKTVRSANRPFHSRRRNLMRYCHADGIRSQQ